MPYGFLFLLVALAGCGLFLFRPAWLPLAITAEALAYDRQLERTLWITGILFLAAQIILAVALFRRSRPTPESSKVRWQFWVWPAGFALVLIELALAGSTTWAKVAARTPETEVVEVYAHQFAWNFRYPGPDGRFGKTSIELIRDAGGNPLGIDPADPDGRDDIVTATLRIPANRDVLLLLHSRDVIHDFFVRELRTKQDIVPGMEIPLALHVDRPGQYEIACAELCGLGHSQMRSVLIVMPPAEYDQWKRAQK